MLFAAAILASVILIRFCWVMTYYLAHPQADRAPASTRCGRWCAPPPRALDHLLGGHARHRHSGGGLRAALHHGDGSAFPYRDLILLTAFAVVLGTLVLQGLTLRPLIRRLAMDDGDPVAKEVHWRGRGLSRRHRGHRRGRSLSARILRKEFGAGWTVPSMGPGRTATELDDMRRDAP